LQVNDPSLLPYIEHPFLFETKTKKGNSEAAFSVIIAYEDDRDVSDTLAMFPFAMDCNQQAWKCTKS
jgi:hypothetical protein